MRFKPGFFLAVSRPDWAAGYAGRLLCLLDGVKTGFLVWVNRGFAVRLTRA